MRSSDILVVDCGTSRVLAGRFRRAATGCLELIQAGVEWLPRRDHTEEGWLAETGVALVALTRRESLAGACVVGLPAHLTFSRVVELPRVPARRRRQIIAFELRQGVPLPLAELVCAQATVGRSGGGQEVVLTAARRSTIEALGARLCAAGLLPVAALPAWLVLRHGLAYNHPDFPSALAVSIGARSTQLVSGVGASCLRNLAVGGDTVTERVAGELGLDFARAELLKREAGTGEAAPAHPVVRSAADEFSRRLGGELARSLAAIGAGNARGPERLYLSGGGAQLAGLSARLAEHLRLPVMHRDPWRRLHAGGLRAGEPEKIGPALLGDLVGLAAAHGGPGAVNLLPRSLRWATSFRRHRRALVAAALLLMAAMGGAIVRERTAANTARDRAAEVGIAIGRLRRLGRQNREKLDQLAEVRRRTVALQRLVEAKRGWIGFLADLQERLAQSGDAWLERLQVQLPAGPKRPGSSGAGRFAPGSGPAGPEAPPIRISLAGCLFDPKNPSGPAGAETFGRARTVLAQIRASPFVDGVENERFDGAQSGVLRFEVTLVLAPGRLL